MNFRNDVRQITTANYACDVSWDSLQAHLDRYTKDHKLDMNPDFQRGHVWTKQQQIDYVEWILKGGTSGKDIYFNCSGWMRKRNWKDNMVLVDGKQRITAILAFINNEIPAFGCLLKDYEDGDLICWHINHSLRFHINDLPNRVEVLQWYIDMNTGGTQHTADEIANVRLLLAQEPIKK